MGKNRSGGETETVIDNPLPEISNRSPTTDRRLPTYGRRRGRALTRHRASQVQTLLPRVRVVLPDSGRLDVGTVFAARKKELWLEIGFGAGEHLAMQAERYPDIGFIGSEVYENGVASLMRHIMEKKLDNVRVFPEDARLLLAALPDHCISRLFILFPDPWPKKRHFKRRFITPETLAELYRVLIRGGGLRIATDIPEYARWALIHIIHYPGFRWEAGGKKDWTTFPVDHVETRYEQKAKREGRVPVFLEFLKEAS